MIVEVRTVEELRNRIGRLKSAVNKSESSNTLQSCYLVEATSDGITGRLKATALDSRSHQLTLCLGEGTVDVIEPGQILIHNDFFNDMLGRLPSQAPISLEVSGGKLVVKCGLYTGDVFLHQGNIEDYHQATTPESMLPEEIARIPGTQLTRLISESLGIISDEDDLKLVGRGNLIHAYAHDRNQNIVSHIAVEAREQSTDWCVSLKAGLAKLINKAWNDDVAIHLAEGKNGPVLALKCNQDYFVVRQLSTEFTTEVLDAALAAPRVGSFIVDGGDIRSSAKLLDLARKEISIEVKHNLVRFGYSHANRAENDLKVPTKDIEDHQPGGRFSRDLLKRAIMSMDVDNLRCEWVEHLDGSDTHFLRFIDEDLPAFRQVMITPTD